MAIFKQSSSTAPTPAAIPGWKVLVVDDEPEVHNITRLALGDFSFENKGLEILSAFSGHEARKIISDHPDIALIFLDVVMEADDAGLRLVQHLREEIGNKFVRIILRTGQPGCAPERDVIVNYDINDYKEKTSFDSTKLFTSTYAGLRAYQDIMNIESARQNLDRYRIGLEEIVNSSANLFEIRSLRKFAKGLLTQLSSILRLDENSLLVRSESWNSTNEQGAYQILAGTGQYKALGRSDSLPSHTFTYLNKACRQKANLFEDDIFVGYFPSKVGKISLIYMDGVTQLDDIDKRLIQLFSSNITVAFDNLYLDREIFDTQNEIINTLGDVVESRSKSTANHVKRVSHLSRMLGRLSGMSEQEAEILFIAAPMHDVGKIGIPDRILLKEGKLDAEEWEIMKTHAEIGESIFSQSSRPALQAAAIVAGQHHEKYDGNGYPKGLMGKNIHIYGRIVAIADVFDALSHKRCYKEPWPIDEVITYLQKEKGHHLDPELVDLFIDHIDEVVEILQRYPD